VISSEALDAITRYALDCGLAWQIPSGGNVLRGKGEQQLPFPTLQGAPYVVINTATRDPRRSWTAEQASWVTDELLERVPTLQVVVAGMPAVRNSERVHSWSGSLRDMNALYAGATLVISANSAPVHVAAAANVPVVALYNTAENAAEWYPLGGGPYRVLLPQEGGNASDIPRELVLMASLDLLGCA
jgi:ADP-heptose:LPS heptosyltransferase